MGYDCRFCGKTFNEKYNMQRHVRTQHSTAQLGSGISVAKKPKVHQELELEVEENDTPFYKLKLLKHLSHCGDYDSRARLLKKASPDDIDVICKCVSSVYKGMIPIGERKKILLHRHNKYIGELLDKTGSLRAKQKILIQTGGYLPLVLSVALPLLATILEKAI
jgi:hypothetical protein